MELLGKARKKGLFGTELADKLGISPKDLFLNITILQSYGVEMYFSFCFSSFISIQNVNFYDRLFVWFVWITHTKTNGTVPQFEAKSDAFPWRRNKKMSNQSFSLGSICWGGAKFSHSRKRRWECWPPWRKWRYHLYTHLFFHFQIIIVLDLFVLCFTICVCLLQTTERNSLFILPLKKYIVEFFTKSNTQILKEDEVRRFALPFLHNLKHWHRWKSKLIHDGTLRSVFVKLPDSEELVPCLQLCNPHEQKGICPQFDSIAVLHFW